MRTLAVAPEVSKAASFAAAKIRIDQTIANIVASLPKLDDGSSPRVVYRTNSPFGCGGN